MKKRKNLNQRERPVKNTMNSFNDLTDEVSGGSL